MADFLITRNQQALKPAAFELRYLTTWTYYANTKFPLHWRGREFR